MADIDDKSRDDMRPPSAKADHESAVDSGAPNRSLIQRRIQQRAVQRRALQRREDQKAEAGQGPALEAAAAHGTSGTGGALPHLGAIQASFGRHDVSGVAAHTDGAAQRGAAAMGAEAFATGNHVAFAGSPDLHTAAHEAAHVVQQRAGVQLKGGVGEAGDVYEQHADAVADAVVQGRSAEALLDAHAGGGGAAGAAPQRKPVQLKPTKGKDWVASTVGTGLALVGAGWNQTQIDAEWLKIDKAHTSLVTKIREVEKQIAKVTDTVGAHKHLDSAKLVRDQWDTKIDWANRTTALDEITKADTALVGAGDNLGQEHDAETERLNIALTPELVTKLCSNGGYTPKTLSALVGELDAAAVKSLAGPITPKQLKVILEYGEVNRKNLKALAKLGGDDVLELCQSGANLDELSVGSTPAEVKTVIAGLAPAAVVQLQSLGAKVIAKTFLTPLGRLPTERIAALGAAEAKELLTSLGAEVIKDALGGPKDTATLLYEHRVIIAAILKRGLGEAYFVECWNDIGPKLLDKVWQGKPAAKVATLLQVAGKVAVKSLIVDLSQEELWHASDRLGNAALKGLGEAMRGKELKTLSGGLEAAPTPVAQGEVEAPTDEVMKTLGASHADVTKTAKAWLGIDTFNVAVRRCQAGGLAAAEIADFLGKAVTYKWKTKAKLEAFFDKAGANIAAIVAIAEDFETAGNDGKRPDAGGGGAPATPVHSKAIAGTTYVVAQGDVKHYVAGHSYCGYAMTDANASRGDSSMWAKAKVKSDLEADADTILQHGTFAAWAPTVVGYQEKSIGGFRVGLDSASRRMTKLFPTGAVLAQARMEAVAKLFQSKI